jgi:hypothetical protein
MITPELFMSPSRRYDGSRNCNYHGRFFSSLGCLCIARQTQQSDLVRRDDYGNFGDSSGRRTPQEGSDSRPLSAVAILVTSNDHSNGGMILQDKRGNRFDGVSRGDFLGGVGDHLVIPLRDYGTLFFWATSAAKVATAPAERPLSEAPMMS